MTTDKPSVRAYMTRRIRAKLQRYAHEENISMSQAVENILGAVFDQLYDINDKRRETVNLGNIRAIDPKLITKLESAQKDLSEWKNRVYVIEVAERKIGGVKQELINKRPLDSFELNPNNIVC